MHAAARVDAPPSSFLNRRRHYHASLSAEEREAVQAEWTNGETPIIVATIAFGMGARGRPAPSLLPLALMRPPRLTLHHDIHQHCTAAPMPTGINKADVRFVFHYSLPKSLEGYLQESGRAGRDGRPALCCLYYTYGDAAKSRHMIKQSAEENRAPEEQVLLLVWCCAAAAC